MKHTQKKSVQIDDLMAITCDHCDSYVDDPVEVQAFFHLAKAASYGSIFGDGASIECDLCQHCVKALLGGSLRIGAQPV